MTTNTVCKNKFLDDDGFCSQCGKNHYRVVKGEVKTAKTTPKKVKEDKQKLVAREPSQAFGVPSIEAGIKSNPIFQAARDTLALLNELYGLNVKIAFRNSHGGYYDPRANTIVLGYQALEGWAKDGYEEYATVSYLLPGRKEDRRGVISSKFIATHEFAHALVFKKFGAIRRGGRFEHHGPEFCQTYKELINLVF